MNCAPMEICGLTIQFLKFATTVNGGQFVTQTGVTWTLLLLANNWDTMVRNHTLYTTNVRGMLYTSISIMTLCTCAGGYTISTHAYGRSSSTVDHPVEYLCTGKETNLQDCANKTTQYCSGGIEITCVRRNASGTLQYMRIELLLL